MRRMKPIEEPKDIDSRTVYVVCMLRSIPRFNLVCATQKADF